MGPQALCYRSFGGVFCVVTLLLELSVGVGVFVIGLSQISSFSLRRMYIVNMLVNFAYS